MKQEAGAVVASPGVVGDSAYTKISRGTWETPRRVVEIEFSVLREK